MFHQTDLSSEVRRLSRHGSGMMLQLQLNTVEVMREEFRMLADKVTWRDYLPPTHSRKQVLLPAVPVLFFRATTVAAEVSLRMPHCRSTQEIAAVTIVREQGDHGDRGEFFPPRPEVRTASGRVEVKS